ncbi:hypothetical protein NEIELOOT_01047 [Neisseria elongata subsp. glycolytica ATCC 29315]|uniref:Uncharacterized protein n=1 Tax=Neisseria elongata subsp. glycolytica ATCC 29315 TaxID=546263 RepID=D4DPR0_NEIEG|nr:hypothetical protein NEIELOOT_01047 [Neisseria elongata subsp. glycolytica ATCC 29315]
MFSDGHTVYNFTECSRVSWNTMSGQRSCVSPKFTRLGAR